MAKTKFYKLGSKATTFYDPITKVQISNKNAVAFSGKPSSRLTTAISRQHIVEISQTEYESLMGELVEEKTDKSEAVETAKKVVEDDDDDDDDDDDEKAKAKAKNKKNK